MTPGQFPDRLDAWVAETAQRALGYAMTLTHNREDAEDIVHDCYLRLLAKSAEYDLPRDGAKLLFRSITNACINRSQRRLPEQSLDQLEGARGPTGHSLADRRTIDPAQTAVQHELEKAVAEAMHQLPVTQRAAVELRSLGHSLVEVGEILEISHANARVMLHRARTALTSLLRPFIEDERR